MKSIDPTEALPTESPSSAPSEKPPLPPLSFEVEPELAKKLAAIGNHPNSTNRFTPKFRVKIENPAAAAGGGGGGGSVHSTIVEKGERFIVAQFAERGKINLDELAGIIEYGAKKWLDNGAVKACVVHLREPVASVPPTPPTSEVDAIEIEAVLHPAKQVREIGVFTTETVMPEIRVGMRNVFSGLFNFQLNYVPPAAQKHSWSASVVANAPPVGDRAELSCGLRKESHYMHPADAEKIEEFKIAVESRVSEASNQAFIAGYETRQMAAHDQLQLPREITRDFSRHSKLYLHHVLNYKGSAFHAHPLLYQIYPLPVGGLDFYACNELSIAAFGALNNFWKSEIQFTKSFMLHALVTLDLSARLGAAAPLTAGSRIPLNDRFFLSWRHVRGFKAIGPSTLDLHTASAAPSQRYASTGGNAMWALSASLNMPFWPYPQNGLASMHVFANTGNVGMFNTLADLRRGWSDLFRNQSMAVGAGLVITRIPLIGTLPNGRVEFNVSVPVRFDSASGLSFTAANKYLTERFRFGIVWCSALQD